MRTTLKAGDSFAGYRIESFVARGGMAVVYRAHDPRLQRDVALKLLGPDVAQSESFRKRFIQESLMAASLDHPNIVPVYDADTFEESLYIAMRYVPGPNLQELLAGSGALEPAHTLALVAQVAGALDAAHEMGLVHRDVKPGNVLIAHRPSSEPGHVYLTDFGLTKRTSSLSGLTEAGHFLGTLDYIAPEQILGEPVSARSDVYALGCVLFEMLTGRIPFERPIDAAKIYAHLEDDPPPLQSLVPDLPAGLDAVVRRALEKRPDDRYPSCYEMVADLRAALTDGVVMPYPAGSRRVGGAAAGGADPARAARTVTGAAVPAAGGPAAGEPAAGALSNGVGGLGAAAAVGWASAPTTPVDLTGSDSGPVPAPAESGVGTGWEPEPEPDLAGPVPSGPVPAGPMTTGSVPTGPVSTGSTATGPTSAGEPAPAGPPPEATPTRTGRTPAPRVAQPAAAVTPQVAQPAPARPRVAGIATPATVSDQPTATGSIRVAQPRQPDDGAGPGSGPRASGLLARAGRPRLALVALVVVALAVGTVVFMRAGSPSAQTSEAVLPFAAESYPAQGLEVSRTWVLRSSGDRLHGELLVTARTARAASFVEVLPKALVASASKVDFKPSPGRIVRADPVVQYTTTSSTVYTYDIPVPPGPVTLQRLRDWAKAQQTETKRYFAPTPQRAPLTVTTIALAPAALQLQVGGLPHRLQVTGTYGNGKPAPAAAVSGALVQVDNAGVAALDGSQNLRPVGAGTATVTASLGALSATAAVGVSPAPGTSAAPGSRTAVPTASGSVSSAPATAGAVPTRSAAPRPATPAAPPRTPKPTVSLTPSDTVSPTTEPPTQVSTEPTTDTSTEPTTDTSTEPTTDTSTEPTTDTSTEPTDPGGLTSVPEEPPSTQTTAAVEEPPATTAAASSSP